MWELELVIYRLQVLSPAHRHCAINAYFECWLLQCWFSSH